MIRDVKITDAKQIAEIYNHYIETSIITFEEDVLSEKEMNDRISKITKKHPWLVFEHEGDILGYAYAADWKLRRSYKYSLETTIYLHPGASQLGIGTKLYKQLIAKLRKNKYHVLIAGIALPNDASIALHEKLGFEKVAEFKEVGSKFNNWIDVGYWQLMIQKK